MAEKKDYLIDMKTIVAIATPLGAGGIGIVRISGEDALQIAKHIFAVGNSKQNEKFGDEPNRLCYGKISGEDFSDKGYAVFFKAPNSFTGEDVVELQLHGGVRILDGIVRNAINFGAVPAEKGEFSKRAFLNGKISLSDAEGIIDMINAESASAVRAAYRLMDGSFASDILDIEKSLYMLISGLEASLDYPEEMEDEILPQILPECEKASEFIEKMINTAKVGRIAKNGINVALVGDPNVGKSSLLNAILKRERAIVTNIAGTTRDTVSESFEYKGVRMNFVDTAGIRESSDKIEKLGIERSISEIEKADLVLHVVDSTQDNVDENLEKIIKDKKVFKVFNKCDLLDLEIKKQENKFFISAKNIDGIDLLLDSIYELYANEGLQSGEVVTSERHLSSLMRAKVSLENAKRGCGFVSTDCILIDLKTAVDSLGEITGTSANEEIIDEIFSRFCVGK